MGLNLISLDGKRIRQLRTYAKKCKGCFKTTLDSSRVWCLWCGNRSLYRVSVIVDSSGRMQYKPLGSKQFSHRGLRYPLSAPKSGRHAQNPVLSPDQQVTYRERRQRENKVDPLSQDYVTLPSPFVVHDVTSRGARLAMGTGGRGSRGGEHRRRNPNAVQPKGRRKK
jgi:RNA-binding protein NOB1